MTDKTKTISQIETELILIRSLIMDKIKEMLRAYPNKKIEFTQENVHILYSDDFGEHYEGCITSVWLDDNTFTFNAHNTFYPVEMSETNDYNYKLNSSELLLSILYNMCEMLEIDPATL